MIRTVLTPDQQNISIRLPENYVGKQVEVIAFTINDYAESEFDLGKPITHLASEMVLAKDWLTTEEDEAWKNL